MPPGEAPEMFDFRTAKALKLDFSPSSGDNGWETEDRFYKLRLSMWNVAGLLT
jgi:hypothetical protein